MGPDGLDPGPGLIVPGPGTHGPPGQPQLAPPLWTRLSPSLRQPCLERTSRPLHQDARENRDSAQSSRSCFPNGQTAGKQTSASMDNTAHLHSDRSPRSARGPETRADHNQRPLITEAARTADNRTPKGANDQFQRPISTTNFMEEREQPTLCVDCALKLKGKFGESARSRRLSLRYCRDRPPRCPDHGEFLKIADHGESARCITLTGEDEDQRRCAEQRETIHHHPNGAPEFRWWKKVPQTTRGRLADSLPRRRGDSSSDDELMEALKNRGAPHANREQRRKQ